MKKQTIPRRIFTLFLCLLMLVSLCPFSAFAEETGNETDLFAGGEETELSTDFGESGEPTESVPEDSLTNEPATDGGSGEVDFAMAEEAEPVEEVVTSEAAEAVAFTATAPATPDFYKIVFLDCGRKYFSVSALETLIDNAAAAGMNTVQLAVGNDGLRFLLDDMSLTVNGTDYSSDTVSAGIHQGNEAYSDFTTDELTQTEMDTIITYAYSKGIGIIPCINTPGHMDAIVDCMEYCGLGTVAYNGSARTVDVTNSTAVAFTQALLSKYVQYFASRGCKVFNMGADEYANDVYTSGGMGFGNLISTGKYSYFITYVNSLSAIIENAGMTPMAFNDGIYYNNYTSYGTFDTNIMVCYWSSGWSGYYVASASSLHDMGFQMVNANSDYYWVLGKSDWQCTATKAAQFNVNTFMGSTIDDPAGAQFCIWCDYPQADSDDNVISNTAPVIAAFGTTMPQSETPQVRTGTTTGNPFPQGTADSNSFRIPSIVTLSDGTLVAATDARWNTTYDGGGLDTLTSYSTDGGATWTWSFANYLGDNGDSYNGSASTAFIDPAMAVAADDTVYLLCDLYPYGVALNGSGNTTPSTSVGFDTNGNLLLSNDGGSSYSYYLNLSDLCIYTSNGTKVSGYSVDAHFNITGSSVSSNIFYADSPFTVVRTGYLYLVKSTDGGRSWSAPELISNVKTSSEMACLVAPGGSMVTEGGRIIFPVYSYNGSSESQRVSFLYSDDGVNWQRSASLNYSWGSESECVELDDGTLRFFFRNGTGYVCYADATETGNGYTWGTPVQTALSVNSNTQISALRTSFAVDGKTAILLSCPTDSSARKSGKIFVGLVADDGSMTWPYSMAVDSGSSNIFQYSCLTETADGSIALLYENYSQGWGSGNDCYCTMDFDTYTMAQIAPGASVGYPTIERATIDFDAEWQFCLGDVSGASAKNYDDSGWSTISLPHDFSISQSFTTAGEAESGYLPGGTGWYRKTFTLSKSYRGKDIVLSFDGVYADAYVYVNGTYVGENHYGYSCFAFDISDYVTCDGKTENVIAVKAVNNIPSGRWYSGSGIYRDVTLIVTNDVHTDLNGVSVTTPGISNGDGTAYTTVEIVNSGKKEATVKVKTEILASGSDSALASDETEITAPAGETVTVNCAPVVSSPALWSTDSPNLYTAKITLTVNDEIVDSTSVTFGYRWYSFDGSGFSLNGQALKLNGVCLHNDEGGLGSATYNDAIYRQLTTMKDMGANAIRVTHNPADRDLIELCDRMGLLVIEELFDGWSVAKNGNYNDFSVYFNTAIDSSNHIYGATESETWAEYATRAVVRRDRNSASVILWSLGNEIQEGASADSSFPTIAQNLINWVKAEDSSRPTTLGDNTRGSSSVLNSVIQVIRDNGGVVGFNYASASELASLSSAGYPIYSSETSSATNSRGIYSSQANDTNADGKYHLTSYDTSSVSWGMTAHDSLWNTYTKDYIAGEFVWTGFDYIGEPTPYNGTGSGSVTGSGALPNSSYFGIVDTCGFEKDTYYLYRSQWNKNANTLHLVTAWDSNNMLTSGGQTPVVIYSNAAKVELYRDGELIGTATRTANVSGMGHVWYTYSVVSNDSSVCTAVSAEGSASLYATFNVTYTAGTLSAKAYDANGNEITSTCEGKTSVTTPGTASQIGVSLDNANIYSGGLAYVAFDVLDENGNPITTATNELSITVTGGTILAVDDGDQATTQKYQQASALIDGQHAKIAAYAGKALAIVSGGSATQITVTADGLQGAVYTVGGSSEPIRDPVGLVDTDGSVVDTLPRSMDMGKSLSVNFSGKTAGSTLTAVSSDKTVATASVSGSVITVKSLLDGSADITVTEQLSDGTTGTYIIYITVNKNYTSVRDIELTEGDSTTWTDSTGNYSASVNKAMLNTEVAAVDVSGVTNPGTPATAASTAKLSSFTAGNVIIGYESGSTKVYLKLNGTSLSTTTDPESATVWALSGSSSSAKLKNGSYYLCHSTSALSVSTSTTNASWTFSSGNLSFSSTSSSSGSRRRWGGSTTTTYYLRYSSGFTVSSSTSYKAATYTVTPGTEAIPGEAYTTVTVKALAGGTTGFIMNNTLYRVTVKSACEHVYTSAVTTAPTCTKEGVRTYTCSKCGDTNTEAIAKIDHNYTETRTEPTCTEDGQIVKICSMCGKTITTPIDALGHDYAVTSSKEATCTAKGETVYTCNRCNDTYTTETDAIGHDYAVTSSKEATCTVKGETVYTCSRCNDTYTTETDALGHDYTVTSSKEATCAAEGQTVYTCTRCSDSYTVTTAKTTDHKYTSVVTMEPTCAKEGLRTYTCSVCGDQYTKAIAKTTDHNYVGVVTTEPTCTKEGVKTFTCSVCSDSYTEAVAKLGHSYETSIVPATCTAKGSTVYTCSRCDDSYTTEIDALGHDYTVTSEKAATCTAKGETVYTCSRCTDSYTTETAALGHNYVAKEEGNKIVYTCSRCGDSYSEDKPSTGYSLVSSIDSGGEYVIVNSGYALKCSGSSLTSQAVTNNSDGTIAEMDDSCIWILTKSGSGYTLRNKSTGTYLTVTSSRFWFWTTYSLSTSSSATAWTATFSGSTVQLKASSRYLVYSSGFTISSSASTGMSLYKVNG